MSERSTSELRPGFNQIPGHEFGNWETLFTCPYIHSSFGHARSLSASGMASDSLRGRRHESQFSVLLLSHARSVTAVGFNQTTTRNR